MIIIHGDDTTTSRRKLDELVLSAENLKRIEGKKLSIEEARMFFDTGELFADKKTLVVENPKAIPKPSLELIVDMHKKSENDLVFWQEGNYDARIIKKFTDAEVFAYPLPKYFFTFLDNLAPRKAELLHNTYIQLQQSFVPEQIFFSMVKRVRHLMILKTRTDHQYDEFAKMNGWQRSKLEAQARLWQEDTIEKFYEKLFMLEKGQKTGNLPSDLGKSIDILILSELQ